MSSLIARKKDFEKIISTNLLKVINDGVIVTDLEGKIVFWNNGAGQIFGYKESEVLGKNLSFLYPETDKDKLNIDLRSIKKGNDYSGEWKGISKNGEIV